MGVGNTHEDSVRISEDDYTLTSLVHRALPYFDETRVLVQSTSRDSIVIGVMPEGSWRIPKEGGL